MHYSPSSRSTNILNFKGLLHSQLYGVIISQTLQLYEF